MEELPTIMVVVAALIRDRQGRILLQRSLPHKHHAGLWEFPGGKVEAGETPRQGLAREIEEELGLTLEPGQMEPAGFAEEAGGERRPGIVLMLYSCQAWGVEPEGREGQEWGWFTPADAASLPLPPMDRALLSGLSAEAAG
jgi:8-oxo-dGTP diphosphatase